MRSKKKTKTKTPKLSANWILEKTDIFRDVLGSIYNLLIRTSPELAGFWEFSTFCSSYTFVANTIFTQCIYIQSDRTLLQLTIFSLTLLLEHKKHLIFNLCWFLVLAINCRKKLSFHKNETTWNCQNTRLSSPCLLKVLWLTLPGVAAGYLIKIITSMYLNSIICTQTSLMQHKRQASNDFFMTASRSSCSDWIHHEL